jgi:hypothetical protein
MRRFIKIALPVVIAALAVASDVTPAGALTDNCPNLTNCVIYYSNDRAWNNWNGTEQNGNPVKFYQSLTTSNADWTENLIGYVSDGGPQGIGPFTDGSGLNSRYEGQPIYQFVWTNDLSYAVDQSSYNVGSEQGPLVIYGYNPNDDNQWFVLSSSGYLAPVGANNAQYAVTGTTGLPVLVGDGDGGDGNGEPVYMESIDELQWNIISAP